MLINPFMCKLLLFTVLVLGTFSAGCKSSSSVKLENNNDGTSSVSLEIPAKKTGKINGQVFIVQQNRENVKLGAVQLYVFEEQRFKDIVNDAPTGYRQAAAYARISQNLMYHTNWLEAMVDEYKESEQIMRFVKDLVEVAAHNSEVIKSIPEQTTLEAEWNELVRNRHQFDGSDFESGDITHPSLESYYQWCVRRVFDGCLPLAGQVVMSDADGKFTLELPEGKPFIVMAKESRKVLDNRENYYWIIEVSVDVNRNIMLSNANILNRSRMDTMIPFSGEYIDIAYSELGLDNLKPMPSASSRSRIGSEIAILKKIEDRERVKKEELHSLRNGGSWKSRETPRDVKDENPFGAFTLPGEIE